MAWMELQETCADRQEHSGQLTSKMAFQVPLPTFPSFAAYSTGITKKFSLTYARPETTSSPKT
eukprot:scaffold77146_cov24-Prasinocladus_malaysianus.AAC.1